MAQVPGEEKASIIDPPGAAADQHRSRPQDPPQRSCRGSPAAVAARLLRPRQASSPNPPSPSSIARASTRWPDAIEKAFKEKRHLIVEAGTGTGKTLAYLLPALRRAREKQQRIIISTGTKNLQEQLFFKDVPFLESLLRAPLRVCYMKGRANYLCRHKLYALRDNPLLNGLEEIDQFHHIAQWEKTTETGDRAEINALPENSRSGTS